MSQRDVQFSTSVFSVVVDKLEAHCNPAPCVLAGRAGPISVISATERVTGEMLFIRPGIEHRVICAAGGITAMYLDGLPVSERAPVADRLQGELADIAVAALFRISGAERELRDRLAFVAPRSPGGLGAIIRDLIADPMTRMTQFELADRLKIERTSALRLFKAATGQTFRQFKQWSALQHAARRIAAGELVRTAAMDAGFADTAHLSRTFRASFGLSPSQAIAGLPTATPA
jgi:AraC-like DNA-binding protein